MTELIPSAPAALRSEPASALEPAPPPGEPPAGESFAEALTTAGNDPPGTDPKPDTRTADAEGAKAESDSPGPHDGHELATPVAASDVTVALAASLGVAVPVQPAVVGGETRAPAAPGSSVPALAAPTPAIQPLDLRPQGGALPASTPVQPAGSADAPAAATQGPTVTPGVQTAVPAALAPAASAAQPVAPATHPAAPASPAAPQAVPDGAAPAPVAASSPVATAGPVTTATAAQSEALTRVSTAGANGAPAPASAPVAAPVPAATPSQAPAEPAAGAPAAQAPPAAPHDDPAAALSPTVVPPVTARVETAATATPAAQAPAPVRPPATPVPLGELAHAAGVAIRFTAGQGGGSARIVLHPQELGAVTIHLRSTPDGISATLRADNPQAAQTLAVASDELRRSLEAQGLPVLNLDVSDGSRRQPAHDDPGPSSRRRVEAQPGVEEDEPVTSGPAWQPGTGSQIDVLA